MSHNPRLTLTAEQLAEIEYAMVNDQRAFVRRRAKAIWLKHHGHNSTTIAKECGAKSRNSIYYWFHAYLTGGLEALSQPCGRQDDDGLHATLTEFGDDLPLGYAEALEERVEEETIFTFTAVGLDDMFRAMGIKWCYDPEDQALIGRIPMAPDFKAYWHERLLESAAD